MKACTFTLAWDNIDRRIVAAQRAVFDKLGVAIYQHIIHGFEHGDWLDWVINQYNADVFIFIDIDCIPLNRAIIQRAANAAAAGRLFGVAQTCMSKRIVDHHVYVGPAFMAVSKETFINVGRPSFRSSWTADVGENLTYSCEGQRIPVEFLYPSAVIHPKWPIGCEEDIKKGKHGLGIAGIGTTYEDTVFHLFESRNQEYGNIFLEKANAVIKG